MATYKVLQDIESEDKLFGPFSLKQFIFAAIAIGMIFLSFRVIIMGVPIFVKLPIILLFLPFIIVFGFLAAPLSRDQPNDIWLLARLRFLFKPRVRIWNQDGIQELVTITAPKKVERVLTNNFTKTEVESRLNALANTMDSRGWAVKNVNANLFTAPGYLSSDTGSDRLVSTAELPQEVTPVDILASDDMLDPANNTIAQNMERLIQESAAKQKQNAVTKMSAAPQPSQPSQPASPAQDFYFMNQPAAPAASVPQDYATFSTQQVVAPGTDDVVAAAAATAEEEALAQRLSQEQEQAKAQVNDRMKVIQPLHDRDGNIVPQTQPPQPTPPVATQPPAAQPDPVNPAILGLAGNDDLDVATIARQAKQLSEADDSEVVISLH